MVMRIKNIPNTIAATNTVFIFPSPGTKVMASEGRSHTASMISSNPKILPNIKPKKVEKIPAVPIIAAKSIFFSL